MTAFRRRTMFAAPLVISLASTGCKDDNRTSNPPPPSQDDFVREWMLRRVGPGVCEAIESFECPPEAQCKTAERRESECPPGTSGKTSIDVAELRNGTCRIVPKGCKDATCATIAAPCPLPADKKLPERFVEVWVVEKNKTGDGGCHAEEPDVACPPGVDCNPPVPRKIACPAGVTESTEVRVAMRKDKTCAIVPAGCNAPACATTTTACPD